MVKMDVDHDGVDDFVVGLYKPNRLSKRAQHTVYVFGFDGSHIYPKWRGTTLGRDFVDFNAISTPKGDKLVTMDHLLDGYFALAQYEWNGFGFHKEWEKGHWARATMAASSGSIVVRSEEGVERYRFGIRE